MTSHTNIKYFADIHRKGLKILLEISMISNSHLLKIIYTHCTHFSEKNSLNQGVHVSHSLL